MKLDFQAVRQQIANLLLQYPELGEDNQLRADMIEGETKAIDFLRYLERTRQDAAHSARALEENIKELRERMARFDRRNEAMRAMMFKLMEAGNLKKMELPEATLSVRNGSPKVVITDESKLPDLVCRIKREPDKVKIKELLKAGFPVSGAELSNAESVLTILTK